MYEKEKNIIFDKAYKNSVFFTYLLIGEVLVVAIIIEIFRRMTLSENNLYDALPKDTTLRFIVFALMLISFLIIHYLAYRIEKKNKKLSQYTLAIKNKFQVTLLRLLSFMPILGLSIALTFIENNSIYNWVSAAFSIICLLVFFPRKKNWEESLKFYEEL